jgi:glutaminyl-peptide cyclotransferase
MKKKYWLLFACYIALYTVGCKNNSESDNTDSNSIQATPVLQYSVVKIYPHDTASFTQGLVLHGGKLLESTGSPYNQACWIAEVNLETGKQNKKVIIPPTPVNGEAFFGEGITILNGKLYQLSWKNNKVYVYDTATYAKINELNWPHEGWGITHNGKELIISTGSSSLYFVNPENFAITKIVGVNNEYGPVANLNELEYVNGEVYANVWGQEGVIVKINPESGKVTGKLVLGDLLHSNNVPHYDDAIDVLNGIAWDATNNVLLVTGKNWPAIFSLRLL